MKIKHALIACGALVSLAACNPQNRWRDKDHDGKPDAKVGTTYGETTTEERARAAETFGIKRGDNAPATADAQIVQFHADVQADPDLARAASNVTLNKGEGDNLVLSGTVATDDMKDALEDYCEALVENTKVDCKNEIAVQGEDAITKE